MGIGEVNSINASSFIGQGSQIKAAPAAESVESTSAGMNSLKENKAPEIVNNYAQEKGETDNYSPKVDEDKNNATSSLKEAVEKINSSNGNCEAVFGIHEGTNRVTIKMVDKDTNKVIKEFPPEATLDLIAKAWELAGIMVDEKR